MDFILCGYRLRPCTCPYFSFGEMGCCSCTLTIVLSEPVFTSRTKGSVGENDGHFLCFHMHSMVYLPFNLIQATSLGDSFDSIRLMGLAVTAKTIWNKFWTLSKYQMKNVILNRLNCLQRCFMRIFECFVLNSYLIVIGE